jgi:cell fate regulator YaaT (PSP1 superfamily)
MESTERAATSAAANLVGVQLHTAGRIYACDPGQLWLQTGDHVVIETEHGSLLGTVIPLPHDRAEQALNDAQRIIKKADAYDLERGERNRVREYDALRACLRQVRARDLGMKLIKAEQAFDGSRITFYFSAEGRVDFRELVRELAHLLHTRIEMKQVGARDEAKMAGAAAPCGRELCCSSWLRDFGTVSVKMAKAQSLSLNPSKLAGVCGRLKCCLRYEYETYVELNRALPAIGAKVASVKGEGVVTRHDILRQTVVIRGADGVETEATLADLVQEKAQ